MRRWPPEVKAAAIVEWKAGSSLDQMARERGIPKATMQMWMRGQTRTLPIRPVPEVISKKPTVIDLDDLGAQLVHESVQAILAIARKAQDSAWLEKQSANDLAVLIGVTYDKVLRVLAAVRRDDERATA